MKRFNAIELVILIFAVSIALVIVSTIIGILFGGATTTANEAIRLAVIDLEIEVHAKRQLDSRTTRQKDVDLGRVLGEEVVVPHDLPDQSEADLVGLARHPSEAVNHRAEKSVTHCCLMVFGLLCSH